MSELVNKDEITNRVLDLFNCTGMQAKEFTKVVDLPPNCITEWKKRRANPSVEAIIKLADYFNVSTDYILNGKDFEADETSGLDPEWRRIMGKLSNMSENDRKEVTIYIKGFIEGYSVK